MKKEQKAVIKWLKLLLDLIDKDPQTAKKMIEEQIDAIKKVRG